MIDRRVTLLAALACADGAAIGVLRPRWTLLCAHVRHPHAWVTSVGADRMLAELSAAALWFAAVWLGIGLLAALVAWLPGSAGRWGQRIGRAVLPSAMRGLLAGSAGLGVLLAPVAAGAAAPAGPNGAPGPSGAATTSSQVGSIPAPEWPESPAGVPASDPSRHAAPRAASVPAPIWPSSGGPARSRSSPTRSEPKPQTGPKTQTGPNRQPAPHVQPAPTDPPERASAPRPSDPPVGSARRSRAGGVRVQAGDCLWLIASRRLGPAASAADVAAEWPRWYAANESVIGADPAVIHPGEVLQAPPAAPTSPDTT